MSTPAPSYRQRLGPVHTWAGLLLGGLLFAIFWMGTLSVYDREIDRWMMPATRLVPPSQALRLDALQAVVQAQVPPDARQWRVDLATARTPALRLSWQDAHGQRHQRWLHPHSLAVLPDPGTRGASGFFFPFHYGLHLPWMDLGKWLVGLAAMAMLVLLVSGVVIHRKLLADLFTLRTHTRLPRSSLDLHNLTGVLGLPFHLVITLSGLVIFFATYLPTAPWGLFGSGPTAQATFHAQAYGRYRPPAGATQAAIATLFPAASLDAMAAQAAAHWQGDPPYFVRVWRPARGTPYVELRRSYAEALTMHLDQRYYDATTGAELHHFAAGPAMRVQRVISGLHFIQFEHPLLRALYFVLGLSGCVLIASGLVFWLASRQARQGGQRGWRATQAMAIAAVPGLLLASLAFLAANRLLPAAPAGLDRALLETQVFWATWLLTALWAGLQGRRAWAWQTAAVAALALACVLLNVATTNAYTGAGGTLAAVWGVDAVLLLMAATAAGVARRLGRAPHKDAP